jgi:hypothetical protein
MKKIYNYILRFREKILKLYIIELYEKYNKIFSIDDTNFIDDNVIGILNPNYRLATEKLNLILCMLNKNNIQSGGGAKFNYEKQQYIQQINFLQQKIFNLAQTNTLLMQQLQQYQLDKKILEIEKTNITDKLLFFDKSLEIITKSISNNISNGEHRINVLNSYMKPHNPINLNIELNGEAINKHLLISK